MRASAARPEAPADQAAGLRKRFGAGRPIVPLVCNPLVGESGAAVERLASALAMFARRLLVVDAGESSPALPESAVWGLGHAVERLSASIAYLPARGLARRCLDPSGSSAGVVDELDQAVPAADAWLLHAPAMDLSRMLPGHLLRPVLMCGDEPESLKVAYAGMKQLSLRLGWRTFDLLVLRDTDRATGAQVAATLASCAERYADCTLREWAFIDARIDPRSTPDRDLRTLALGHVAQARPARGTGPAAGMPPLTASRPRAITPPLGRTG